MTINSVITIRAAGGKSRRPDPYPRPVPVERQRAETIEAASIDDFPILAVVALI